MGTMVGRIVGIKPEPEIDGSVMLQVADFDSEPFEILLNHHDVRALLSTLQKALLRQIEGTGERAAYLQATIEKAQFAFQGNKAALLVSTDQLGSLALSVDETVLRALGAAVDSALDHLTASRH